MTIQGRRIPSRDEVRSLIVPKNGLHTIASKAPTPATRERLFGARSIPTSELTFNAKVTRSGARNNRQVPAYANAYSRTNPQPTRRTAGAASTEVRDSAASSPSAGGGVVGGVGTLSDPTASLGTDSV